MLELTSTQAAAEFCSGAATASPLVAGVGSSAMLALGLALLLSILLRRSGRYVQKLKRQAKRSSNPARPPSQTKPQMADVFDRASPLLDAPDTVVRWQVEMQELARGLKAEIDTKMRLLQVLIRQSNEAAERLEAAAARAQRLGCIERPEAESLAALAATRPAATATPVPPYADQVYGMAAAGEKAQEIAEQIGVPLGDVELLLSLRGANGEAR